MTESQAAAVRLFDSLSPVAQQVMRAHLEAPDAVRDWAASGRWLRGWSTEMRDMGAVDDRELEELLWIADGWVNLNRPMASKPRTHHELKEPPLHLV